MSSVFLRDLAIYGGARVFTLSNEAFPGKPATVPKTPSIIFNRYTKEQI